MSFIQQVSTNIAYTPVISGSTTAGTGTYTGGAASGGYSIVGNICHFWFNSTITAHTGTGNFQLSLPITAATITNGRWGITIGYLDAMTSPASTYVTGVISSAGTVMALQSAVVAGGAGTALVLDVAHSIQGSGWYNI